MHTCSNTPSTPRTHSIRDILVVMVAIDWYSVAKWRVSNISSTSVERLMMSDRGCRTSLQCSSCDTDWFVFSLRIQVCDKSIRGETLYKIHLTTPGHRKVHVSGAEWHAKWKSFVDFNTPLIYKNICWWAVSTQKWNTHVLSLADRKLDHILTAEV